MDASIMNFQVLGKVNLAQLLSDSISEKPNLNEHNRSVINRLLENEDFKKVQVEETVKVKGIPGYEAWEELNKRLDTNEASQLPAILLTIQSLFVSREADPTLRSLLAVLDHLLSLADSLNPQESVFSEEAKLQSQLSQEKERRILELRSLNF